MFNNNESIEKIKQKKTIDSKNTYSKEKEKLKYNSKKKNKNIKKFSNLNKSNKNHVYENKNIIINDITDNYNNTQTNFCKAFNNKIKKIKLSKLKDDDISMDIISHKYNKINTGLINLGNMNKTISNFKLSKSNCILKKSKNFFKSALKDKITKPNKNKKNKYEIGDSYEFNFTFNNFNNNFTQNNINGNYIKSSYQKRKKVLENSVNKTIINDFASVRNNIIKDIKDFISNNKKKKDIESQQSQIKYKVNKIGVIRKNKKKNKDVYSIKIQKVFRGFIFRKKFRFNQRKNFNEKSNSSNKVYVRKKILNKKIALNLNINDISTNYLKEYNLTDYNRASTKIEENKINNTTQENKIEEIIIDKNKLLSVLGPMKKRKKISEITINFDDNFEV